MTDTSNTVSRPKPSPARGRAARIAVAGLAGSLLLVGASGCHGHGGGAAAGVIAGAVIGGVIGAAVDSKHHYHYSSHHHYRRPKCGW